MKYIRAYNESNIEEVNVNEIQDYLMDIFQEVADSGIRVHTFTNTSENTANARIIGVNIAHRRFSVNYIYEYLLSSVDYMNSIGYEIDMIWFRKHGGGSDEYIGQTFFDKFDALHTDVQKFVIEFIKK